LEQNEYIESLIAKVLSQEATDSEWEEVEVWKNESSDNLDYFKILSKIYTHAPQARVEKLYDTDAAWLKLKSELEKDKTVATIRSINSAGANWLFLRIAASIILVAGLSFVAYKFMSTEKVVPVSLTALNTVEEFKLPDSTQVVLNKNSKLIYSFSGNKRKAELNGEAFFDLGQDLSRPFELKAGNLTIHDIGTSFNVKASEGSDSVIVFVESGEVVLTSPSNNYVNLIKGEKAVYLWKRDQFIKEVLADTNALAYKTKIFVFENASLIAVVQKLNEVYDSNISVAENIQSCHITATFRNESVEAIVDIIAETLALRIRKENGAFFVEGEGCEK